MPATVSLRVGVPLWLGGIDDLVPLLEQYRGVIEEVALFTGMTHPPLPLSKLRDVAQGARPVLSALRAMGLRAGINHLATIGHLSENLDNSLSEPWQRFVSSTGEVEPAVYCATDPRMQQYIRSSYEAFAHAEPDFIWIDDDVRLEARLSPGQFCFCDLCLDQFSTENGRAWTRESLVAAFNSQDRDESLATRRAWLAHNRSYVSRILSMIRETVFAVNPAITLGLMSCELAYSGYGFDAWASDIGSPAAPAKFRPGGGFYTDATPTELIGKLQSVARQIAFLPESVTDIQYEHENFPYISLAKSAAVFRGEIAGAIGSGCSGVALNMLPGLRSWRDDFGGWLDSVAGSKVFYDRAADVFGRSPTRGLWSPFTPDNMAIQDLGKSWFGGNFWSGCHAPQQELALIGMPLAQTEAGASVTLLSGDGVRQFDEATLRRIFGGGVLMDGAAVVNLAEMGLGDLCGFKVVAEIERDTFSIYGDEPMNAGFDEVVRDCRPSFWPQVSYVFEPLGSDSRTLAKLSNFSGDNLGVCEAICENGIGGRTAVMGYFPWSALRSLSKATQTKRVARWLSRDACPAYVASFHQAPLWVRSDSQGRPAVMMANMSVDPAETITVAISGCGDEIEVTRMDGKSTAIAVRGADGPYRLFDIGPFAPWEFCLLTSVGA